MTKQLPFPFAKNMKRKQERDRQRKKVQISASGRGAPKSKAREPSERKPGTETPTSLVSSVAVADIIVLKDRPQAKRKDVQFLAVSMSVIGLLEPITVWRADGSTDDVTAGDLVLVAGLNRLEAAKRLKWERIDCIIVEGDAADARMREISENLHRKRGTILYRAELLAEYERLQMEKVGQVAVLPGGRQPNDTGLAKAAKALGVTREKLRRARLIAGISPEAKDAARRATLANNQAKLIEIAKTPPEGQLEKVRELEAGSSQARRKKKKLPTTKSTMAPASKLSNTKFGRPQRTDDWEGTDDDNDDNRSSLVPDDDMEEGDADEGDGATADDVIFEQLKDLWEEASDATRTKFLREVVKNEPSRVDDENEW